MLATIESGVDAGLKSLQLVNILRLFVDDHLLLGYFLNKIAVMGFNLDCVHLKILI